MSLLGPPDALDYMHARYCSPVTGRFLGVDRSPKSIRLGRPQTWNRFSYVLGNPLKYIDPSGLAWFLIEGKWQYLKDQDEIGVESKDKDGNPVLTVIRGRDRFVTFTGGSLTLYDRDGSRKLYGAVSGQVGPGGQTQPGLQPVRNVGPIPEGRYFFNPAFIQNFDRHTNAAEKAAALVGRGGWPGGKVSWGNQRAELTADPSTNTYGRSGFYIHGGSNPGSAGCIDLCANADDFFSAVGSEPGTLDVDVDYP